MKYLMAVILCLLTFGSQAQKGLSGKIVDEKGIALTGATVVLLDTPDSTMNAFAISDEKGEFTLEDISEGLYILQISFVSYNNISQEVDLVITEKSLDLGEISMTPSTEILKEVTIKAEHIPMGISGDTINYNTAAFKTKPGASVEDLLKKLPGIEVERDGSIKAQGEDVNKVLVDGKEFFGNDPKIATQNLEAEAVDKVQVFDKQSEIAEFTGVDDGQEEKAINLQLKEDYKNGGFGKLEAHGGTEDRYNSRLNYNRFSPSMQASIIASDNNINQQSFTLNDYISFMGGLSQAMSSNNGVINFGEQFSGGGRSPQGLNRNSAVGLNFNYDLSSKAQWTSNYFYTRQKTELRRNSTSEQFLNEGSYTSIDTSTEDRNQQGHRL